MAKIVIGLMQSVPEAERMVAHLTAACGCHPSDVLMGGERVITDQLPAGIPEEDARYYREGLRQGGSLVSVRTCSEAMAACAVREMERYDRATALEQTDDASQKQIIDIRETMERPVITKRARVVEEVVIRKEVTQHPERIRDSVRKTHVRVERTVPHGGIERRKASGDYNGVERRSSR
jgi:hypothetical protein